MQESSRDYSGGGESYVLYDYSMLCCYRVVKGLLGLLSSCVINYCCNADTLSSFYSCLFEEISTFV